MKKKFLLFSLVFLMFSSAFGQRRGAMETGGYFSFKNVSGSGLVSQNYLNLEWLFGYYLSRDFLIEVQPNLNFNFGKDSSRISLISLLGLSYRIIDMAPYDYRRIRSLRKRDLGASAGVFATLSGGFWTESANYSNDISYGYSGPALSLAIGTHSAFGKFTLLRTKAQLIYLLPSGPVYKSRRVIFQLGVGFSVFIKV